jgi:hypothetical protein
MKDYIVDNYCPAKFRVGDKVHRVKFIYDFLDCYFSKDHIFTITEIRIHNDNSVSFAIDSKNIFDESYPEDTFELVKENL